LHFHNQLITKDQLQQLQAVERVSTVVGTTTVTYDTDTDTDTDTGYGALAGFGSDIDGDATNADGNDSEGDSTDGESGSGVNGGESSDSWAQGGLVQYRRGCWC